MHRVLLTTAALMAAVAVWVLSALPPRPVALVASWSDGSVPGVLHVHTNRSDGRSGFDEIAAAASRAGLAFVVFTDHGDGTRAPEPPVYRSGVLCLVGVEISTTGGHYVAFDMDPAPYPLGGEPRDVIEDVRRLGGVGIVAHPDSPKAELAWRDWTGQIDGIEILNPDTSWRVRLYERGWRETLHVLSAIGTYPFRPSETISSLLTESSTVRGQWTTLTDRRRVVGIAGSDAHAKLALREVDPGDNRYSLPLPGYEASFRALSVHVTPSEPLSGDALLDARRILQGIRRGRVYIAVDAWAAPPAFEFTATNGTGSAVAGDELGVGGDVSLRVRDNAPGDFSATVWRGRDAIVSGRRERDFTVAVGEAPGVYRVEIHDPRHPGRPAWITSNPIYVRAPVRARAVESAAATSRLSLFDDRTITGWTRESDATSLVAVDVVEVPGGAELRIRYGLSGGSPVGQYAGVAVDTVSGVADYDRVAFTIRAERAMRLSVQMRVNVQGAPPERWQRSVLIDPSDGERVVAFDDMTPVGQVRASRPSLGAVRNLMFVVDTTHTRPGESGRIWIKKIRLEAARSSP